MSTLSNQQMTGYLTWSSEDKECDETKSDYLRCQESRTEFTGYTNLGHTGKQNETTQTPPPTRTWVTLSRATASQGAPLANLEELDYKLELSEVLNNDASTTVVASAGTSAIVANTSDGQTVLSSFGGSDPGLVLPPSTCMVISTASGHTNPQPTVDTKVPLVSNQLTDGTEQQNGPMNCEEGAVRVVRRELVLDRTAEPNALPFVLQGYVAWIGRVALDPIKLQYTARDFVLSHFGDGDESRWIVGLIANIGSRIGSMEFVGGEPNLMLSMLQAAVRRRLGSTSSKRAALAKALNSAIEAMLIHFHASPLSETVTLRQEAAPIFRQLYSASPGAPIDLYSLIQHPCLWHYAFIDILFGVATDMPTLFRYEVSFPSHQHSTTYQGSQGDGIIQWLHGIPNQLLFVFAYMKLMRGDGLTPNDDTVASLERTIHELPPFDGSSSNRFVSVIRSVVQECWKQAALIYLYMAVCGDSSATPRVKEACKRYMRLLNSTQPGRLPDEHLVLTLQLVSPAAQRQRDRAVIKQRALGLYTRDRTHRETTLFLFVMDDVWTRADTEDRPVMWSDVAVSQKRILGA